MSANRRKLTEFGNAVRQTSPPAQIQSSAVIMKTISRNEQTQQHALLTSANTLIQRYLMICDKNPDIAEGFLEQFTDQYCIETAESKIVLANAIMHSLKILPDKQFPKLVDILAYASSMAIYGEIREKFPLIAAEYIASKINYAADIEAQSDFIFDYISSQAKGADFEAGKAIFDNFMYYYYTSSRHEQVDLDNRVVTKIHHLHVSYRIHLRQIMHYAELLVVNDEVQLFPERILRAVKKGYERKHRTSAPAHKTQEPRPDDLLRCK
jgi:hypothetical protein